jgi:hypothetical protein
VNEIIFVVEEAPEGGYSARAVGESIFTQAEDMALLQERVRDAVRCHFDEGKAPEKIWFHLGSLVEFVRRSPLAGAAIDMRR